MFQSIWDPLRQHYREGKATTLFYIIYVAWGTTLPLSGPRFTPCNGRGHTEMSLHT